MTDIRVKLLAYGLAVLALIGAGFAAAWFWQANAYGKVIATSEASHQADLSMIAQAGAAQARAALEKQKAAEKANAELDAKFAQEKIDDLAENDRLRRAVAYGDRRLRIAGTCRAGSGNVSNASGTAGVGDAGTVELSAATGRTVLDLRASIIADQTALRAAQQYIRNICNQ